LGEIHAAMSAAFAGRGKVLCLSGEPGIGKTRLADEAAIHAASGGMRVHWGRCFEDGGVPAYWPWIQVLRRIIADSGSQYSRTLPADIVRMLPELAAEAPRPETGDPEQLRFRLFDAVARLLRESASVKPMMLVLDDLHDADLASLQLLKFVARVAHDAKLIIVATYRDAEMRRSPERAAIIPDILRDATHLALAGLAEDEVGRMVEVRAQRAADPEFVATLCRTTAGNPLFVHGIIRVLAAEGRFGSGQPTALENYQLPDEVRAAIQRWLGLLSPEARTLLTTAALIGLEFEPGLLGKATATAPERVAELIGSAREVGIASSVGTSLCRFAHPLLREVLFQEPTGGERVWLHRAIATALEQFQGADAVYFAQLAHHFQLATDDERAIDYSIRAAAAARSIYAYEQEISHLATAKDLAEKTNQNAARRASILERLGIAIDNINQTSSEAKEILESAAKFYEETGKVSSAARVLIRLGSSARFDVSLPSAQAYLNRAESLLVGKEEDETLAALYVAMSDTCYFLGKYEDGLRWSQRAMELAEKIGSPTRWVQAACAFAQILFYVGRLEEGLGLLRTALSKAIELGNPELTSLL
jgi:predicted ATPase